MSDIDLVILVVHSNNPNLSPPRDEEPRKRAQVKSTAWMEGVDDGMMRRGGAVPSSGAGKSSSTIIGSSIVSLLTTLPANQLLISARICFSFF